MSALTLPSFEVKGFRAFKDLRIERLGRVNLIVGKNNVGKTALLEALQIYASRGYPRLIWDMLSARDEIRNDRTVRPQVDDALSSLRHVFFGRPDLRIGQHSVRMGPVGISDASLTITLKWMPARESGDPWKQIDSYLGRDEAVVPVLAVQNGSHTSLVSDLGVDSSSAALWETRIVGKPELAILSCKLIPASGMSNSTINELWDQITLTDLQKDVLNALRLIAPGIEGLNFIALGAKRRPTRIPIVRVSGLNEPIPLRSLGDGMQRMLGIALALVNAKDGILLVDEIENGLHYTVLPQVWRLIFETARRLNVQVFATSHSWECIQAFQQAAEEDTESEGLLIRLQLKGEQIVAVLIGENDLGIATRQQIEVR